PTSMSARPLGTRLPVATTEARARAAAKPTELATVDQLRGSSGGAPGTERTSRRTNSSPTGTASAANSTVRNRAMPPVPGAGSSPVPSGAGAGPGRGMSAPTVTSTRTATAGPMPERRAPLCAPVVPDLGFVRVTPGSSQAHTEPGKPGAEV